MTLVRPAASSLPIDEAMSRVVEIKDYQHLLSHLKENYWESFQPEDLTQRFYSRDRRIGWSTWLLCIKGQAVLFMKGRFHDERITTLPKDS